MILKKHSFFESFRRFRVYIVLFYMPRGDFGIERHERNVAHFVTGGVETIPFKPFLPGVQDVHPEKEREQGLDTQIYHTSMAKSGLWSR